MTTSDAGGPRDFHVYVAVDHAKTVVALLPPLVAGTARHNTTGAITYIRPYSMSRSGRGPLGLPAVVQTGAPRSGAVLVSNLGTVAGVAAAAGLASATTPWLGVPVGGVVAGVAYWQAARRQRRVRRAWAGGHRVLNDRHDREVFLTALSTALRTLRAWPVLRAYVRLDDPSPTLARSLWDLAGVLARRAPVRETRDKLAQVLVDVPTDSPVHADVTAQLAQAEQAQRRFDADVERRLRDLTTLADEADRFVRQQEALAEAREALTEAREVIRDADLVLDELTGAYQPVADASAELAERTTAVLDAYLELTNDLDRI